jgi:Flp pilus assembly protein TadD, contains TPR repeats
VARAGWTRRLTAVLGLALAWGTVAAAAPPEGAATGAAPVTLDPAAKPSRDLHLQLISQLRESGRAHAALAHLDAYEREHPRDARAGLLRGDCLADIGDYAGAEKTYRRLLRTQQAADAYAGLGRVAGLQGRWSEAATQFGEAVKRAPISARHLGDLGYALLRAGDAAGAVFRLRQAAELAPGDARVRNNLILALEAAGQHEAARRLLDQVRDPADRKALEEAREALRASGFQPNSSGAP